MDCCCSEEARIHEFLHLLKSQTSDLSMEDDFDVDVTSKQGQLSLQLQSFADIDATNREDPTSRNE